MASPGNIESDDEFGYDLSIEDEQLLATLADDASLDPTTRASSEAITTIVAHDNAAPNTLRSRPKGKTALRAVGRTDSLNAFVRGTQPQSTPSIVPVDNVQYPDLTDPIRSLYETMATEAQQPLPNSAEDTRSPLARFRTFPRKPFSVSDLTAGAWCELQYEYTLTRLPGGRKTRTTAMKVGSNVHQKLEDQVHTTVKIEIIKREDAFGLKLWNIIQGLRTLRDTGLTRELEVWGFVDGNLVNGIIDMLSYQNPNPEFEEEWLSSQGSQSGVGDESQKKITTFFASENPAGESKPEDIRKIYLTDVKTRGSRNIPKGAAIRPTKVQLFLYHRFLAKMAGGHIDFFQVFNRYGIDADEPFSDDFLAQIGELHDDIFHDSSSVLSDGTASSQGSSNGHVLLKYRTLRELVPLLREELMMTFPAGSDTLGSVVTVEYRHREDGGGLIGTNIMAVDTEALDQYLGESMQWWRGERRAAGVDVEEAYKCGSCEFAEICRWRQEMDLESLERAREKKKRIPGNTAEEGNKTPARRGRRRSASPA